ncbi:MAG: HDOD domain-containing protein [Thermodesulfobacteriota bacterium]|nr:HDOD domain-containing protein [Thermodesulfobacteriota bacterium]
MKDIEKKFIQDVDNLVPRPDIALDVLSMAHDINCNFSEMAKKIEMDPSLTANMLRVANSAYFGYMRKINSVHEIIIRLGMESVKLIAITSASVGLMKSPQEAYNMEPGSLWYHSHATAILATILADYAHVEDKSAIYTAALLHDIGKILLNRPLQLESCNRDVPRKFSNFVELEEYMLQTNHAKVGMALLQKWGLSDNITIPVGFHHTLDCPEKEKLYSQIIYLANFLVESIGIRSVAPEQYMFNVYEFLEQNQSIPDVPNVQANMENIINEFFTQFNKTAHTS